MLDVTYYKDYRHNYLILKDNGSFCENIYQRKMVTENKIKGLLSSQERYINGETLLYYEITSRQSIASIYGGKNISIEQLRRFFSQLKVVNDALQKYLLDSSCLVLKPEYVFQNIETGEYTFLYYPDPEEGGLSQLIDFFISKVNAEDLGAVEMLYKIAELISREQFVLDEVLTWFQEEEDNKDLENREKLQEMAEERDRFLKEEEGKAGHGSKEEFETLSEEDDREEKENSIKGMIFIWVAGILAFGVLFYIWQSFQLSYQETIYIYIAWIIMAITIFALSLRFFYLEYRKKNEKGKKACGYREEKTTRYYEPGYEREVPLAAADAGNTVFIPLAESCENKLYSMDRKNKCHIDLEKLPLTVGKLAGAVDMAINEQSLSRMHARFSRMGKSIYVTDYLL